MRHADVAAVAVDSKDRVYLFTRGDAAVLVYEQDGRFVRSWDDAGFTERTHGITIGPDDSVYCVDDADHSVRKFTTDGVPLLTLGSRGRPSDTGYDGTAYATIARSGPPFNRPTNLAIAPDGAVWFTEQAANYVGRFDPRQAAFTTYPLSGAQGRPAAPQGTIDV